MAVDDIRTALGVVRARGSRIGANRRGIILQEAFSFLHIIGVLAAICGAPDPLRIVTASSASSLIILNLRQGAEPCSRILTEGLGRFPVHQTTAEVDDNRKRT